MSNYTEEELNQLSEAEREALLGDEDMQDADFDEEDETGHDDKTDDTRNDGDDESVSDEGDNDEADSESEDGEKAEGDKSPDDEQPSEPGQDEQGEQAEQLLVDAPPEYDYTEQLKAISDSREELYKNFDEGEIDAIELNQQLEELNEERRKIDREITRAEVQKDIHAKQARNVWEATVNNFLNQNPDYTKFKGRYELLDMHVRRIATENPSLSGKEVLELADKHIYESVLGIPKEQPQQAKGKPLKKPVDVPPTLNNAPASDMQETSGGKWESLDRLLDKNPDKYEEMIAKLSDSELNEYLARS